MTAELLQAVAAGLSLLATLGLLYYARTQAHAAADMAKQNKRLIDHQVDMNLKGLQPCVVLDHAAESAPGAYHYVAKNIGRGPALNAIYIRDPNSEKPALFALGALAPEATSRVPDSLYHALTGQAKSHDRDTFLIASVPVTPNGQWVAVQNRIDSNGRVSHEAVDWQPSDAITDAARFLTLNERLQPYLEE